jgi:hypothetical protein
MPNNPKQTSKPTASKAGREMHDKKLPPAAMSGVASALGQAPLKKAPLKKKKEN